MPMKGVKSHGLGLRPIGGHGVAVFCGICLGVLIPGIVLNAALPGQHAAVGFDAVDAYEKAGSEPTKPWLLLRRALDLLSNEVSRLQASAGQTTAGWGPDPALVSTPCVEELEIRAYTLRREIVKQQRTVRQLQANLKEVPATTSGVEATASAGSSGASRPQEIFLCNRSSPFGDVCVLQGSVRLDYESGAIALYPTNHDTPTGHLHVRPYLRKWDPGFMSATPEVELDSLGLDWSNGGRAAACLEVRRAPAVVLAGGGAKESFFDDLREVFLPLYHTVHHLEGEVVLVVAGRRSWMEEHDELLKAFTKYRVRFLAESSDWIGDVSRAECFTKLTVGLKGDALLPGPPNEPDRQTETTAHRDHVAALLSSFRISVTRAMELVQYGSTWNLFSAFSSPDRATTDNQTQGRTRWRVGILTNSSDLTSGLTNVEELSAVGTSQGLVMDVLDVSALSVTERIRAAHGLDGLVGVTGGNLALMAFMRPQAVVVQLNGQIRAMDVGLAEELLVRGGVVQRPSHAARVPVTVPRAAADQIFAGMIARLRQSEASSGSFLGSTQGFPSGSAIL